MRFLCDMGVSRKVAKWLRDRGHDCSHLGEEGLACLPNGKIFDKAVAEGRIVLTFDLDFGEIAATAGEHMTGVVVFRLHNARADHVIGRMAAVLEKAADAMAHGAIVSVEETRLRIRHLPLGE